MKAALACRVMTCLNESCDWSMLKILSRQWNCHDLEKVPADVGNQDPSSWLWRQQPWCTLRHRRPRPLPPPRPPHQLSLPAQPHPLASFCPGESPAVSGAVACPESLAEPRRSAAPSSALPPWSRGSPPGIQWRRRCPGNQAAARRCLRCELSTIISMTIRASRSYWKDLGSYGNQHMGHGEGSITPGSMNLVLQC